MKKVFHSAEQAINGLIFDGMKIAAGGFGLCGIPENLMLLYCTKTKRGEC